MTDTGMPGSVVVGIDGSQAAITAAKWAIAEAVGRDVPLRLVHVTGVESPADGSHEDVGLNVEYAEEVLRVASAAVEATTMRVKVETATLWGSVDDALIEESFTAAMVCVGSTGIGRVARKILGSTAAELAEHGHCPVAIIRSDGDSKPLESGWIAVTVDDDFDNDAVIQVAMGEALLREMPLLALGESSYDRLDRELGKWVQRYPEIHVQPVAARSGAASYVRSTDTPVRLVVVGRYDDDVLRIVGPHDSRGCSVLVVRS